MKKTDTIIIGAGPVGLFAVHQLGIKGLKSIVIDNLDKAGGQCIELYPDKPIYDIPAVPECTGEELTNKLLEQIKPFKTEFFLNERVEEVKQDKENWIVKTNNDNEFSAPNIIVAGGVGSFEPRKLAVKEAEKFEDKFLFYAVKDKEQLKNKNISIFGGGDSALDWALELSKFSKINLIHRRDDFRAAQATVDTVRQLAKEGKINLFTKFQMTSIKGEGYLESIDIKSDDKELKNIKTDFALGFFGLIMQLGPIANWGLNIDKKTIDVDTEKFETSTKGLFAVGDINDYPGKLDLILCGFHDTTLAVQEDYRRSYPGERVPFGYTTSNTKLQRKLGVSD